MPITTRPAKKKYANWVLGAVPLRIFMTLLSALVIILIGATFYGFIKGDLWGKKIAFFRHILILDVVIFSIAALLLIRQFFVLMKQRRQNLAGSGLHSRIVKWLSWIAVLPPIVIALFSWLFFQQAIQSWFNQRVKTALEQSTAVAEAYLEEHKKVLAVSAEAMALDIAANWHMLRINPEDLDEFINAQTQIRSLNEAILFDTQSRVWARAHLTVSLDLFEVLAVDLEKAQEKPVIYSQKGTDRVRALVQVIPNENIYLLVGKYVDSKILKRIRETKDARSEYMSFQTKLDQTKLTFGLIFILITLLILVLSAWLGLWFAEQIAGPIGKVIAGAEAVSHGKLNTRVDAQTTEPDIQLLANTFNRMIINLSSKQKELVAANEQIEERRRFIQSVLENVSTGVISFDVHGKARLINSRALEILQESEKSLLNRPLAQILPESQDLIPILGQRRFAQGQIHFHLLGGKRNLLIRISLVALDKQHDFTVVTFDDVTDLMHAQKQAAWSDVARRIAHEIKNPLTPIQLSTERLRKRYSPQIHEDVESFTRCLDTISRQVEHIGHLVNEFSAYAKMPQPVIRPCNLRELIQQHYRFYQDSYPEIEFQLTFESKNLGRFQSELEHFSCDPEQIGQVLSNLLQNAIDSIKTNPSEKAPKIHVILSRKTKGLEMSLHDNGPGFPTDNREDLMDPYVTYKEKGTGLGLAIVKKIITDHEGSIKLIDSQLLGGACVSIFFPNHLLEKV